MTDELLRPRDVARWLNRSEQLLANWRYEGRGPRYVKVGGQVRYRASDVEAWLEANTVDPSAA